MVIHSIENLRPFNAEGVCPREYDNSVRVKVFSNLLDKSQSQETHLLHAEYLGEKRHDIQNVIAMCKALSPPFQRF